MVWLWTAVIVLYLGGGALGLLALRSILTGAWGNTGFSKTWEGLIKHHRFAVTTTLITLAATSILGTRTVEVIIYGPFIPEPLIWLIGCWYLFASFLVGLIVHLKEAGAILVLVYVAGVFLWPLTPWETFDSLTYDTSWLGVVIMQVLIPSFFIWAAYYAGRIFGKPVEKSP